MNIPNLIPSEYMIQGTSYRFVRINKSSWKVIENGFRLKKDGTFSYEPMPSSRDEEFVVQHSFDTVEQAYETLKKNTNALIL